ncbi:tyrosine-type recombinase/integrase [Labrys okinawensis]|uniref:tyrosine-type recombinase/integrase n=1 Tax=Labrys okinawensis TaxID=346911 RepID=UPI0039BD1E28
MAERTKLTAKRIEALAKDAGERERFVRDTESPLGIRILPGGKITYMVRYRLGGRGSPERRYTIGPVDKVKLKEAQEIALKVTSSVAAGGDPQAEKRRKALAPAGELVDAYIAKQRQAGITNVEQNASCLRRYLLEPLGQNIDIAGLARAELMERVEAVRKNKPGAAKAFRLQLHALLAFALDQGRVPANVLAGGPRERRTRAERLRVEKTRQGRQLTMEEIAGLWQATLDARIPVGFGGMVRFLLVAGTRRNETALAQLDWLTRHAEHRGNDKRPFAHPAATLRIPPATTKNGQAHFIPLPEFALAVIDGVPRLHDEMHLFPSSRLGAPISGWSKLWPRLLNVAREYDVEGPLTLHDLRKTARSHWSRLGIATVVAELMLNHRSQSTLEAIYNLEAHEAARADAMARWCQEIEKAVREAKPARVEFKDKGARERGIKSSGGRRRKAG